MPRHPRNVYPGAIQHVYARGNEKREVFLDDVDRRLFLSRLEKNLIRWDVHIMAWALMPNHFHLLVRCPNGNLASFMQCLLTGYSQNFNRRHERVGHLFQNRYKSEALSKEGHFRELVRYIHLNPIRACILRSLEELSGYLWTGHQRIVSGLSAGWQDLESIREMFHSPARPWRQEYVDFLEAGIRTGKHPGHPEADRFSVPAVARESASPREYGPQPPTGYHKILETVSAMTGLAPEVLAGKRGSARVVRARRLLLSICREELNAPVAHIARWVGIPTYTAWYLLRSAHDVASSTSDCKF